MAASEPPEPQPVEGETIKSARISSNGKGSIVLDIPVEMFRTSLDGSSRLVPPLSLTSPRGAGDKTLEDIQAKLAQAELRRQVRYLTY